MNAKDEHVGSLFEYKRIRKLFLYPLFPGKKCVVISKSDMFFVVNSYDATDFKLDGLYSAFVLETFGLIRYGSSSLLKISKSKAYRELLETIQTRKPVKGFKCMSLSDTNQIFWLSKEDLEWIKDGSPTLEVK